MEVVLKLSGNLFRILRVKKSWDNRSENLSRFVQNCILRVQSVEKRKPFLIFKKICRFRFSFGVLSKKMEEGFCQNCVFRVSRNYFAEKSLGTFYNLPLFLESSSCFSGEFVENPHTVIEIAF